MKAPLRKNLGNKNCELTPENRKEIMRIFLEMEESEISKIFDNAEFGYWTVTVERPLRLRVFPEREIPEGALKATDLADYTAAIKALPKSVPLDDWTAFAKATKLKAALLKKVRPYITEKDSTAKAIVGEADVDLRDTENIPFTYEGGIHAFIENEVKPYAPDAYVDETQTKIGYEISFTKYFYKPTELRPMRVIIDELKALEKETSGMLGEILGDL
jgi:type I restriction enzyme M protein